jgi:hypothetical protein
VWSSLQLAAFTYVTILGELIRIGWSDVVKFEELP